MITMTIMIPMIVTLAGIVTTVSCEHPKKAVSPSNDDNVSNDNGSEDSDDNDDEYYDTNRSYTSRDSDWCQWRTFKKGIGT